MIKITPKPKKWPKYPWNLKTYWNTANTWKITKMTKIFLKPLIWQKYTRNIQNTSNLYFGNLKGYRCILFILQVYGYFGNFKGFKGILVILNIF